MTKKEFIEALASRTNVTKRQASDMVEAFWDIITESLKNGEPVAFTGIGKFEVRQRAARTGVNPATGAKLQIPATTVPAFKAGKGLKEAVK